MCQCNYFTITVNVLFHHHLFTIMRSIIMVLKTQVLLHRCVLERSVKNKIE